MLKVKELKPNVWELTLSGVVEKADIETMERELTPVLKGDGPLGLVIRAENWTDLTANAMAEDAKFEFGLMSQWAKIAKMALVTDMQAFAAVMKWIDPILPMIDMKSFGASDAAAAEAFASDLPIRAKPTSGSGVTLLSDGTDGLIAYEVNGKITSGDVDKVLAPIEAHLTSKDKVDLLVRFKDWEDFDLAIITNGSLIGGKMGAITNLRRYAIVGAPGWMKTMVGGASALMPFEMKMFNLTEDDAAWTWVRAA